MQEKAYSFNNSMDNWNVWLMNSERVEVQEKIDSLLGEKTEYSIYLYG